jgi:hypothetical protein
LSGKVFISCGMHLNEERQAVEAIRRLLTAKFNLPPPYVAVNVQSLGDIMNITKELRSSDYYLFIDFKALLFSAFCPSLSKLAPRYRDAAWLNRCSYPVRIDCIER